MNRLAMSVLATGPTQNAGPFLQGDAGIGAGRAAADGAGRQEQGEVHDHMQHTRHVTGHALLREHGHSALVRLCINL